MKTKFLHFAFLLGIVFAFPTSISSQEALSDHDHNNHQITYKRVSIPTTTDFVIEKLHDLGIDLTCGAIFKDQELTLELHEDQLNLLENENINYNVLIDDMQKFYSERAVNDLPNAIIKLQQEKALSASRSFSVNEILNNVGQYDDCDEIDWPVPANWNLNPNSSPNSFGGCLTYDQVLQELDDMRSLYPNLISVKTNASPTNQLTVEGRTVYYVRISDNPDVDEPGEPETLYQSLIHSRESASVMQLLYYMWYLLENYNSDDAIKNLVDNQALYFIPVFNPDGFVYNQTIAPDGGGGQRKNRNTSASGSCSTFLDGIDLNRNSAYYWGNGGSSTNSCSDTYLGTAPFSENETQIMRDFFLQHDFKLALNHHSFKNAMLHAYAGTTITNPRPDEYSKYNHDMTYYNRYAYGPSTSISALNSGNMNDWMLGGPAGVSANGTPTGTGSGKNTMAWTPENGLSSEGSGGTYGGFWPTPSNFLPIAKRAMRMNFMSAYFSGKYAKLHDLNQSDITSTSGDFQFAIERLGQTDSDFTVTVTPVSSNIISVGGPSTQSGMAVLQQNNVNINYALDPTIQPNDEIEFKVVLTNDYTSGNVLYEANIIKKYNPIVLFTDNPDNDNLTNWTTSGGSWSVTSDAFTGSSAITSTTSSPYSNNESKQIQMNGFVDLTGVATTVVQFYAKWDLERSFDYVQIEGSTNGTNWTPLCGKLTKPGAPNANNTYSGKSSTNNNFQPDGEKLYDGDTQGKWNMEEIVIDSNTNSFLFNQNTVFFRFDFKTDGTNREDSYVNVDFEGFTFDDFKVISNGLVTDTQAPSAPTSLTASNITETTIDLNWTASTDNIGVSSYDVYQNTNLVGNTSTSSFNVTGLTENTVYDFYVVAKDAAGNESNASNVLNISTLASPNCNDGIQNGDETGIDCGGSSCAPCPTVVLNEGFFETGLDGWIDGGNDCARVQSVNSFEGAFSIRIRDNSGTSSSMISPTFDLTSYEKIDVSFYYYANSMENNEDFWLQFNNGSGWVTVSTYVSGQEFTNGSFNIANETITDANYGFTANSRIRIICDASGNNDQVFIDQVITTGTLPSSPDTEAPVITLIGSSPIDLDVGGVYTEQGATATDNIDGDISGDIIIGGDAVNTSVVGTYIVTYNVSDAAGNAATEVTRTVNINEIALGCSGGINSFPYAEGFENTFGAWTQSTNDDLNWSLNSGSTPSNGTGPSNATEGTFYIYVEASGNGTGFPSKQAILNSPCFDLSGLSTSTFSFSYHMFGSTDMGTIDLEITSDEGLTWTTIWSESGNKGNSWQNIDIDISSYVGRGVQFRFNRITGGTWQADIAIDNISVIEGAPMVVSCSNGITNYPYTESFENTFGAWTQSTNDDINWSLNTGSTPSSGTGPSLANDGTFYIYVEASGNGTGYPNKQAIITSPCFDLTNVASASFEFAYHMFGSTNAGIIELQISNNNGSSWSTIWSETGNNGDNWLIQQIELNSFIGTSIQLRFNRTTGTTWQADVAIDGVSLNIVPQSQANTQANNKQLINTRVELYPNPVSKELNVSLLNIKAERYEVVNAIGQVVLKGSYSNKINVSKLDNGTYVLKLYTNNSIETKRFVKN